MPTKTATRYDKTYIESPNVIRTVEVDESWTGTAIEILEALEQTDTEIAKLLVNREIGAPKVTIYGKHGDKGHRQPVPETVHNLLEDWGYQHAGENTGDHKHTDDVNAHVYTKDE